MLRWSMTWSWLDCRHGSARPPCDAPRTGRLRAGAWGCGGGGGATDRAAPCRGCQEAARHAWNGAQAQPHLLTRALPSWHPPCAASGLCERKGEGTQGHPLPHPPADAITVTGSSSCDPPTPPLPRSRERKMERISGLQAEVARLRANNFVSWRRGWGGLLTWRRGRGGGGGGSAASRPFPHPRQLPHGPLPHSASLVPAPLAMPLFALKPRHLSPSPPFCRCWQSVWRRSQQRRCAHAPSSAS